MAAACTIAEAFGAIRVPSSDKWLLLCCSSCGEPLAVGDAVASVMGGSGSPPPACGDCQRIHHRKPPASAGRTCHASRTESLAWRALQSV
eukprot:scaffold286749_cov33-Tisochrysis_lutea.AAC.2